MKRPILLLILLACTVAYAASTTTNYSLYKPSVGDVNWGTLVNNNFDIIDTQMKTNADAISTHTSDNSQAHSDYLINNGNDTTSGTITASGFIGNVTGNVSGTSGSTTGNAGTATALAANGANCNAGNFPLGVDASGAVESCTDVWTEAENTSAGYAPLVSPSFTTPTLGVATATSINKVAITAPATSATLTIANGKTLTATNTVNLNTMTDGKWCKYTSAGTVLDCNVDPVVDTNTTPSDSTWTMHNSYPAACSAGQYVSAIGDTLTCSTPTGAAHDAVTLAGRDYLTLATQQITAGYINTDDINWTTVENIANTNINWTTMTDLTTDGAVVWSNLAEGELADSTVVSADIKDGTITAADTAITAGRSLTWSTNEINADAELYTSTISFVLESPADADAFLIWKAPHAITITDIDCIVGAATSAVIDIQECGSDGTSCSTVDAAITCDADGAADDGSLSNAGIDAGDWLKLDIGKVTGTVKYVSGTITYTKND